MHPYRTPAPRERAPDDGERRAIFWAALVVWTGSVLRAIVGAMRHELLGEELGFALLLAIVIPWLARRGRCTGAPA